MDEAEESVTDQRARREEQQRGREDGAGRQARQENRDKQRGPENGNEYHRSHPRFGEENCPLFADQASRHSASDFIRLLRFSDSPLALRMPVRLVVPPCRGAWRGLASVPGEPGRLVGTTLPPARSRPVHTPRALRPARSTDPAVGR
nr:hypothetical protein KPHV_63100 [Kitasatospora purpeofusca]